MSAALRRRIARALLATRVESFDEAALDQAEDCRWLAWTDAEHDADAVLAELRLTEEGRYREDGQLHTFTDHDGQKVAQSIAATEEHRHVTPWKEIRP